MRRTALTGPRQFSPGAAWKIALFPPAQTHGSCLRAAPPSSSDLDPSTPTAMWPPRESHPADQKSENFDGQRVPENRRPMCECGFPHSTGPSGQIGYASSAKTSLAASPAFDRYRIPPHPREILPRSVNSWPAPTEMPTPSQPTSSYRMRDVYSNITISFPVRIRMYCSKEKTGCQIRLKVQYPRCRGGDPKPVSLAQRHDGPESAARRGCDRSCGPACPTAS